MRNIATTRYSIVVAKFWYLIYLCNIETEILTTLMSSLQADLEVTNPCQQIHFEIIFPW